MTGDRFHPVVPPGAVYVGRPSPYLKGSPWANPYPVKVYGLGESLRRYGEMLTANPELVRRFAREHRGEDPACWCKAGARCHVDVLLAHLSRLDTRPAERACAVSGMPYPLGKPR